MIKVYARLAGMFAATLVMLGLIAFLLYVPVDNKPVFEAGCENLCKDVDSHAVYTSYDKLLCVCGK